MHHPNQTIQQQPETPSFPLVALNTRGVKTKPGAATPANLPRRTASALVATVICSPLIGCGGGGSSGDDAPVTPTPPPTTKTKDLKVAYESARDLSTAWTTDGSVLAIGQGDFQSSNFVLQYGQIANGADKIGFTIESATKCTYYSNDNSERIVIDRTNPDLVIVRQYKNGTFSSGWGIYKQNSKTYAGSFATDITPSMSDLKDVREVSVKVSSATPKYQPLLARLIYRSIPSAHAATSEQLFRDVADSILKKALSALPYVAALATFILCGNSVTCLATALAAYAATGTVFNPLTANASDQPPRTYPKAVPPNGTIAYGHVVYVDDGTCPAGQIKKLTGGNMALNIPRKVECAPLPAAIP